MDTLETMRAFVAVVAAGSFRGGAERLGVSPALVSKYVSRLEDRLGTRLLNRTTRSLSLTEAGAAYAPKCQGLLESLDELEAGVRETRRRPQGTLRVTAPRTFGDLFLPGVVATYLKRHPAVDIQVDLNDRFVDLVEEGFDLAVRIGDLADSSLRARRMAETRTVICAAPSYLEAAGRPRTPDDLERHDCIIDTNRQQPQVWSVMENGDRRLFRVRGRARVNSALACRDLALAGEGVACLPLFAVLSHLRRGLLTAVLEDYPGPAMGIHAVYPHGRYLPAKVRAFMEILGEGLKDAEAEPDAQAGAGSG